MRRAWLADVVAEIWERSRRTYGWRRIQAELAEVHDHTANKKLLRAVMREHHISGLPRPKAGRRDLTRARTAAHLVNREFSRDGPNLLWMTDIERHEAFLNPAVVRGHRLRLVAASWLKLRAAGSGGHRGGWKQP